MDLPDKTQLTLLKDAADRDHTTARRLCLTRILWHERYLTRAGLIARVEGKLGTGCFGKAAWQDTFYRDMRVVKQALHAAGYELAYSRRHIQPGYYLRHQPVVHPDLARILDGSAAEVDPAQIAIYRHFEPAERFLQGCSITDTARDVVVYRIRQRYPELNRIEAAHLALSQRTIQ